MATVTNRKLRSPLKWHGGKSYLARRIVGLMPPHETYCEPFIGGASVLLNKPKVGREVAGDLNADLINFWEHVNCVFFRTIIRTTPYAEPIFDVAKASLEIPGDEPQNRAINFLVRNRMSRGGLGRDFAWSERLRGKTRPGGPVPGDLNAWDAFREELPRIAERVEAVEFNCCDALQLIRSCDGPATLHYCDPPYLHETRTHRAAYAHEMTEADHAILLDALDSCRGAVMLSGYPSRLYDDRLKRWERVTFDMPNHSGQNKTKQRRTEVLWIKGANAS